MLNRLHFMKMEYILIVPCYTPKLVFIIFHLSVHDQVEHYYMLCLPSWMNEKKKLSHSQKCIIGWVLLVFRLLTVIALSIVAIFSVCRLRERVRFFYLCEMNKYQFLWALCDEYWIDTMRDEKIIMAMMMRQLKSEILVEEARKRTKACNCVAFLYVITIHEIFTFVCVRCLRCMKKYLY